MQVLDSFLAPFRAAGLLARRLQVYGAAFYIYRAYCGYEARAVGLEGAALDAHWDAAHTRLAGIAVWHCQSLLGLWVKLAQFLSSRSDVLPDAWILALAALQDAVPPRPWSEVRATLREELGFDFETLFTSIDKAPLAAASIAQVHRATIRCAAGTRAIVLKVQHRGVSVLVKQDLANAKYLCEYVVQQRPEHDFRQLLREWVVETEFELDFQREALNTDLVGAALAERGSRCRVPDVIREAGVFPTLKVLPLEFIDGVKPNDAVALRRLNVNVDDVLRDISDAFASTILIDGRFNADPHPGNILVDKVTKRAVLLDFGLTKVLPDASRLGIARLIVAAAENDAAGVVRAIKDLSLDSLAGGEAIDGHRALDFAQFLFRGSTGERRGGRAVAPRPEAETRPMFSPRRETAVRREAPRREAAAGSRKSEYRQSTSDVLSQVSELERRPEKVAELLAEFADAPDTAPADAAQQDADDETDSDDDGASAAPRRNGRVSAATRGKMYASEATPGTILFVLRVVGCLRGIAVSLGASHSYLSAMRPAARQALIDATQSQTGPTSRRQDQPAAALSVVEALRKLCEDGEARAITVCAYVDGTCVVDESFGTYSSTDTRRVDGDTLFHVWSAGKGVSAALVQCLVADGIIESFDGRISDAWPLFSSAGKADLKIRDVLEHTSGLARCMPPAFMRALTSLDARALHEDGAAAGWRGCQKWCAKHASPDFSRGRFDYHAVTFGWLVGGVVEKSWAKSGRPKRRFDSILEERLVKPLGLEGHILAKIPVDASQVGFAAVHARLAPVCVAERFLDGAGGIGGEGGFLAADPRLINDPSISGLVLPSATMHASARGLAALYGALARDGALADGKRLLPKEAARSLQRDFAAAAEQRGEHAPLGFRPYALRNGNEARFAFGHSGLGNLHAFADPETKLGIAVCVNQLAPAPLAAEAALRAVLDHLKLDGFQLQLY